MSSFHSLPCDHPRIRRATAEDSSAIKQIDSVVPLDPDRVKQIDSWLQKDVVLVAELDKRIVGYGVFSHKFFNRCQVEMLMVDSRFCG
jgi:hypothetical protein